MSRATRSTGSTRAAPGGAAQAEAAALRLAEIRAVLGCAKATASRLRAGDYSAGSELAQRYAALSALAQRLASEGQAEAGPGAICRACPREDCSGCRIAELVGQT